VRLHHSMNVFENINLNAFLAGMCPGAVRIRLPNLKSLVLTILELLAFNAQKNTASSDPGHGPFSKKIQAAMSGLSRESTENKR